MSGLEPISILAVMDPANDESNGTTAENDQSNAKENRGASIGRTPTEDGY